MHDQPPSRSGWLRPWLWGWTIPKAFAVVVAFVLLYAVSFLVVVLISLPIDDPQEFARIRTLYFPIILLMELYGFR